MRKRWFFLMFFLLVTVSLYACVSKKSVPPEDSVVPQAEAAKATDVPATEVPTPVPEGDSTGYPVVDSFNRFMAEKNRAMAVLQELISQDPQHGMMAIGFLAPAAMDLEMLPITFIPAPETASRLGNLSFKVIAAGNAFKIEMVNVNKQDLKAAGQYDEASNSLYFETSLDGKDTAICEYTQLDQGLYFVQYYAFESKKAIRLVFDDKDMALGILTQETPDPLLYKNPPSTGFEFAKNNEFYIYMKDGKLLEAVEKQ